MGCSLHHPPGTSLSISLRTIPGNRPIMNYIRLFGIGPTGIMATLFIWILALQIEKWLGIPKINMGTSFRWIVFCLFAFDCIATIVWSLIVLRPTERGRKFVTTGPFQWVRYPLYSAIIWSGTGMMVMWYRSWTVIFSVFLINFFWTWHVQKEEHYMLQKFGEEYREYMKSTGQFFPRFW